MTICRVKNGWVNPGGAGTGSKRSLKMRNLVNLVMQQQIIVVTLILLVMYIIAVVPKAIELLKYISKNKSFLKKTMFSLFFLVSISADLAIMVLAIHGLVYFLNP